GTAPVPAGTAPVPSAPCHGDNCPKPSQPLYPSHPAPSALVPQGTAPVPAGTAPVPPKPETPKVPSQPQQPGTSAHPSQPSNVPVAPTAQQPTPSVPVVALSNGASRVAGAGAALGFIGFAALLL
ncbi:hypothetical protein KEM56_000074, partial [Ascosphaera pollenicola]